MELKQGDLVITLPEVHKVKSIRNSRLGTNLIGVIVETDPRFDHLNVYGVLIDGVVYYLFEDEIRKLEEEC